MNLEDCKIGMKVRYNAHIRRQFPSDAEDLERAHGTITEILEKDGYRVNKETGKMIVPGIDKVRITWDNPDWVLPPKVLVMHLEEAPVS